MPPVPKPKPEEAIEESAKDKVKPLEALKSDVGVDYTVVDLLQTTVEKKASDLHLTAGAPPYLRIDGELQPMALPKLTPPELKGLVYTMMSMKQIKDFELDKEFDFAYSVKSLGRFRVNVYKQRGSVGCVIRAVPTMKLNIEQLGLPAKTKELITLPRGIIFVTGPTGSGKTTSLASMIDYINNHRRCHIMTVEDPIEYLHQHKLCLVNQRELGQDTDSFARALRHVLRQDPDVILVGELRDLESMQAAITAAETGHLVLTTLHTNDAGQTIDRIIDVFPASQQNQIKLMLANSLQAIFCQTLCKRIGGGRVMAYELLIATNAVRNLIRKGEIHQIKTTIETSQRVGMRTMNQSLIELVRKNVINIEEAREHTSDPASLEKELRS
ncbi:type IV pilus twitching motility protein PilT [bacterium]|nr:type IV pilus twitching motility protein PilT [bacterium]